jgi:hypothetical protein
MRVPVGTYVTYEELFGTSCTIESFRQVLSKYQRSKVLYLCGLINCITRKWHGAFDKRAHDELVSVAFKPALLDHLCAHPGTQKRVVLHRLQTLFIAKEVALYGNDEGIDPLNTPHWGGLGEAFVMANDHLHMRLQEPNQTLRILTENLSLNEYSFPSDLRAVLARGNLALTQFIPPPTELDLRELFHKASGFDLDQFRIMCLGVVTQYFDLDGDTYKKDKGLFLIGPEFFRSTTLSQEVVDMFLKEVSFDAHELKTVFEGRNGGPLDFTPFRDRPLIRIGKAYFPIDVRFLAEKLEAGVFWKIHASLDRRHKSSLHSAWGKGFESYSNWLFRHSVVGKANAFHETPMYENSNNQVTDAIVVCGDKAVFVECKTAMIRSEVKYGGRPAALAGEIYKKFVESDERPQGVKQLAAAINAVFSESNSRRVTGIDLSKIIKIYPVIITKDSIGGSVGISNYLRRFFNAEIERNALTVTVAPLFCLSIDQMEEISDVLGNTSLAELLHGWWLRDRTLGTNFLMSSSTAARTQTRSLPSALIDVLEALFDETIRYFPETDTRMDSQ